MLKIRLQRVGRKHEPSFRLVLTDSKNSTKSGKFKEILGSYDPRKMQDVIDGDRVKHWLSKGAKATGTVHNLLIAHKVIDGKKINVLPKKTYKPEPIVEQTPEPTPEPSPELAPEPSPEPIPESKEEVVVETKEEEVVQ